MRSVSILEYKVEQAVFFLREATESASTPFAAQCHFDAFASAARSITFAMQAVLSDHPGFSDWYEERQSHLRADPTCVFFNRYRRLSIHIGDTVVSAGSWNGGNGSANIKYFFMPTRDLPNVPTEDVATVCDEYFRTLLRVVYDCMRRFRSELDDRWYFTADHFCSLGRSIEDAEEELGFPRGWTAVGEELTEADRWRLLRKTQGIGCQLNGVFLHYLGQVVSGPDDSTGSTSAEA